MAAAFRRCGVCAVCVRRVVNRRRSRDEELLLGDRLQRRSERRAEQPRTPRLEPPCVHHAHLYQRVE